MLCFFLPFLCGGGSGGGNNGGGGASAVPEIDVSQGLAAVAIVLVVALVLREVSLRSRA
ncbi:MAG: hypothetical protein NW206_11040 [Hyphomonadaceae bacterium]|nr:hypothetical protein [Hyphomonadaceae bacterium]